MDSVRHPPSPLDANSEDLRVTGESISVCVLTYNHAHAIEETLSSLLHQTVSGYEIIVSDDCSTDGTWEKILELAQRDQRIRPIKTPRNLRMPGNANFAVGHSHRPFIALLHHDDIYRADLLEKWGGVMMRHPDVAFVFNAYDDRTPELTYGPKLPTERVDGRQYLESVLLKRWGCPIRGTAMIRRSSWEAVGGMREEFDLISDVDLWMRLCRIGAVGYVPDELIKVRIIRPDHYPDIYTGKNWHWKRHVLLYEIHAANLLAILDRSTLRGRLRWFWFRCRLNFDTAKWLAYAVVRKRPDMIRSSEQSKTAYDFGILNFLRRVLQKRVVAVEPVSS